MKTKGNINESNAGMPALIAQATSKIPKKK